MEEMIYIQQSKWLTDNGFVELSNGFYDIIIWEKELLDNRILQFSRYNHVPDWSVRISGNTDDKFNSDVWLVDSIPSYADFNQFQPLIDIIK